MGIVIIHKKLKTGELRINYKGITPNNIDKKLKVYWKRVAFSKYITYGINDSQLFILSKFKDGTEILSFESTKLLDKL